MVSVWSSVWGSVCLPPQECPLEFTRPSRLVCAVLFALIASKRRGRVAKSADCGLCSHTHKTRMGTRVAKGKGKGGRQTRTKRKETHTRNTDKCNLPWIFRIPHTPCVPGRTQTGYSYRQLVSLHSKYSYCSAKLQINTLIESQGIRKYLACINSAKELEMLCGMGGNGRAQNGTRTAMGTGVFVSILYLIYFNFLPIRLRRVCRCGTFYCTALLSSGMQF